MPAARQRRRPVGRFHLLARLSGFGAPPLRDIASQALHLANCSITPNNGVFLPLKPARAACRLDLLDALVASIAGRCQGRGGVAGEPMRV